MKVRHECVGGGGACDGCVRRTWVSSIDESPLSL
jgi:hypothetical protein